MNSFRLRKSASSTLSNDASGGPFSPASNLINEFDVEQHRYFWNAIRAAHVDWIEANNHETARSRMRVYYDPIWKQMEPRIAALASQVA